MTITSTVAIDLVDRDRYPLAQVYAKQDDSLSRAIAASIYAAGVAWVPPSGATAVIRYRRPDGIGGIYDELPDGSVAYTIADNVITAYIAPDALSCPGRVRMDIVIVNGTEALATFDISVLVDAAPTSGVAPTNGYYKYKTLADINAALAARVQSVNNQAPDNKGNVQINAEQTGAVSQTAFDAAMTTVVRKVNGVTPDDDGNVNVSGGSGGKVESVNGKTGAVNLTAGDVGAVPCQESEGPDGATYELDGHIDMVGHKINRLGDPAAADDAVTKAYVDRKVQEAGGGSGGEDGGYYAPSVDSGGNLTWTASKAGMPQVSGANIKGPAGADGTPITWQGEWVSSNVYAKNDAVSYDGSAWVMTAGPVVGAVPGVDGEWALMARRGADVDTDASLTISGKAADAKITGDNIRALSEEIAAIPSGKDGADGQDGITPTIGDNGNWYLGDTDTGKPSRGETGPAGSDGKDGADGAPGAAGADGYTPVKGTDYFTAADKQEIAEAAAGLVSIPTTLPNPNALTFTGAVTGSYDGSAAVTVNIPSGGGAEAEHVDILSEGTLSEDVANIVVDGFAKRMIALAVAPYGSTANSGNIKVRLQLGLDNGESLTINPIHNFVTNSAALSWNKIVAFAFVDADTVDVTVYRDGSSDNTNISYSASSNFWWYKGVYTTGVGKITSVTIGLQADGVIGKNTSYKVVGA